MSRRLTIPPPTVAKVDELAHAAGFVCDEEELKEYAEYVRDVVLELIEGSLGDYARVYDLPEPQLPVKYPRDLSSIVKPRPEENPHNAWALKMDIKGAAEGKLAGKKLAIKDNVQIAGVPMVNGSELVRGFVPTEDAVVVTKILDAGGHIIGTTNVEDMCISGASITGLNGPVLNPHDKTRVTGGSSSGSGAVICNGDADLALGCDQGGSIRIPASWCGITGLKPTHGLVSYTGVVPIDTLIDHIGPMAKTVEDCALLLEVIAGYDGGLDPRIHRDVTTQEYTKLMTKSMAGRKIGYVKEGFDGCDQEVCDVIKESFKYFEGITVEEVSIPWHKDGKTIWTPPCFEGTTEVMINNMGAQYGMKGYKSTRLIEHMHDTVHTRMNYLAKPLKFVYLLGAYVKETCGPAYYARCCNLLRSLTKAYDDALDKYDVLLMPTLPYVAPKHPETQLNPKDGCELAFSMVKNTAPFNCTGHPALSINAGFSKTDNLPVGLTIVGKHFDEGTVLAYARTFEQKRDAK